MKSADTETIQAQIERLQNQAEQLERQQMDILSWDFERQAIRQENKWRREHTNEMRQRHE
ncbi:HAD-IG family 5'-nucleotidase [Deinococcus alpinitundrae]|uniref:HAD-IG family 5'-nucleotidase n=1 Tax=Deinococcus alpinitundrae TaxID=468913 RepID=UPI00137978FF|nr:HAD-IG family 5'-nucleotidase [Deinococcus alpinitundrae]